MRIEKRSVAALVCAGVSLGLGWIVHGQAAAEGQSFAMLYPGYTQRLFGVVSSFVMPGAYIGGITVLQNGDVVAAECLSSNTRLHRFSASATHPGTTLHVATPMTTEGGCGIVVHPDGFLYSNRDAGANAAGVVKIDPATGSTVRAMGPAGNALGIAVDPKTDHLVYAGRDCRAGLFGPTCTLWDLDPVSGRATARAVFASSEVGYVGGLYFDPSGDFIFLNNRFPTSTLTIVQRNGQIVQHVPMPPGVDATGVAFHSRDRFAVTNNSDGTMTMFRFGNPGDSGDDGRVYGQAPVSELFAWGGMRGDLTQVGPDGCLYVTQAGTRYDDFTESPENSIVRMCAPRGHFVPPRGIQLNIPPSADLRITAAAPGNVPVGGTFNYTFTATNDGDAPASNVVVTHQVPAKTTLLSHLVPAGWVCTATTSGNRGTLTCRKASMAVGETALLTLTGKLDCLSSAPASLTVSAMIASSTPDPDAANNFASAFPPVTAVPLTISGVAVQPSQIWPPNHRTVEALVSYDLSGGCDGEVKTKLSVRSNERLEKEPGEVDGHQVSLEASRRGNGNGRVYTVTITATDGVSTARAEVEVVVPHDRGNNRVNGLSGGKN